MMIFKRCLSMLGLTCLLALSACGGGGGSAGTSPIGGGNGSSTGTVSVSDLSIQLTSSSLVNSGTATVTATITALDANRNTVSGATLNLSVDNGILTTANGLVTNSAGIVTAQIGTGSDLSKRNITLTAAANGVTRTAALAVVDATGGTVASDISLALSSPSILNSGSTTVQATVTAVDANRNVIAGIPVTLKVDNGATIAVSSATTNASGIVTGTVGIGADKSNRVITITATSGTLTARTAVLQVTGAKITGTAVPAVLAAGAAGKVQFKITDANNTALTGQSIVVAGPGGVQTSARTDINGAYDYSYTAPAATGTLDIVATSAGMQTTTTIVIQSGSNAIPNVTAGSVRSSTVRANPSVVTINAAGSTSNRVEVRALFVGDNNLPIKNVRVRFDLNGDANSIGGTFSTGTTLIYSDANGVALSSYISGSRSSPTDGVTIRACWDYADFASGTCPNTALTTLTVIADALSVSIGTDGLIVLEDLVYVVRFVVQVNDSSGLAKPDVTISPLVDLPTYFKGEWNKPGSWTKNPTTTCDNEDVNRNGVLEVYSNGGVEDANGNRQLDPRKADVVVSFEGSNKTSSVGRAILRLVYPRNVGSWATYALTVAAAGVSGTEGRATYRGTLPVPDDVLKLTAEPAFRLSPYGQNVGTPLVVVSTPDGSAQATLCSASP